MQVSGQFAVSQPACRGFGHNVGVASKGKRAAPKQRPSFRPGVLLLAAGVTLGVIAWGYLVKAAIDFGIAARSGTSDAWLYLGLASLGAIACLFIGLLLVARLLRVLGITSGPTARSSDRSSSAGGGGAAARPIGGRRANR